MHDIDPTYYSMEDREERILAQGIPKTDYLIKRMEFGVGSWTGPPTNKFKPGPTKKVAKKIFLAKLKPLLMDNLLSKIPAPELDEMITSSIIEGVDSIQQENTFFKGEHHKGWPEDRKDFWEWGEDNCVNEIRRILAGKIRDFKRKQETIRPSVPNPLPLHSTPKSYIEEKMKKYLGGRTRRRKRKSRKRRKSRRKKKSRRKRKSRKRK